MEFYDPNFNRYNGEYNNNFEKRKSVSQQMYPSHGMMQMQAMPMQIPMMSMRPSAEVDYNRWMSENYQQPYRTAYFDREEHRYEESEISPVNSKPNSPRYGPGPPICTSDRVKGPRGCNLFVFHLPNEITNWDLYLLFRKYGSILSVHTMINKTTGLSKGYGFVSFSARDEAKKAIAAMDGFRLGKKRLKVQVKRDQDDGEGEGEDFDEGEAEALFTGSTSEMASGDTTGASTPHHAYCSRSNSHGSMDSLPSVDSRLASSLDTAAERSEASIEEGAEAEEFELKGK